MEFDRRLSRGGGTFNRTRKRAGVKALPAPTARACCGQDGGAVVHVGVSVSETIHTNTSHEKGHSNPNSDMSNHVICKSN